MAIAIATRGGSRGLAKEVEHGLFERDALGELRSEVAVGTTEDVIGFESKGEPDLSGFLTNARVHGAAEAATAVHVVQAGLEETPGHHRLIHR
jgi:hypothetical protein